MAKKSTFNLEALVNTRSKKKEIQVEGQITLQDWIEWKEDIRSRMEDTVENFIVIGYRFKQIRETRMFEKDNYKNLKEFAKAEYGISDGVLYRLMKINDKYSVGGNSMEIKPEFVGYGYSQLQEMLYLSEDEMEEVHPGMTVKEIRAVRNPEEEVPEEIEDEDADQKPGEEAEPEKEQEAAGGKVATSPLKESSKPEETWEEEPEWKEPKKKPEKKPVKLPPVDAIYREKMGKTMLGEITDGSRRYILIKTKNRYRVGNTVLLTEHDGGKATGKVVKFKVSHLTDDSGGLIPGYCILGFLEFEEGTEEVMEDEE